MTPTPASRAVAPAGGVIVIGAGGHGKVVADLATRCGIDVIGYADADPEKLGRVDAMGRKVAFSVDSVIASAAGPSTGLDAPRVLLGIGENAIRWSVFQAVERLCGEALTHPDATVAASARLGTGTIVAARAVINAEATVGRAVIVNSAAVIEHDSIIADGVHVSPGAILAGGVRVGFQAWIGAGAIILPGVAIGDRAVVGAGAVVLRDVPNGRTVVGVPARDVTP